MNGMTFEAALSGRVDQMLDACTKCGRCVEVCPSVQPAGIMGVSPQDVITGVLDILRTGHGPQASRTWATSCMLSGECIKACDYGVNPRFLLAMARVAMLKDQAHLPERRRNGVTRYRDTSRDVAVLSRLQLEAAVLERLGQGAASVSRPSEPPDFVFYTGCNVLKTPHIALLALDMMDTLGISYQVMGGRAIAAASCKCARAMWKYPAAWGRPRSRKYRTANRGGCFPGVRAATSSSPRRRCRPSSGNAAHGRSR